MVVAPAGVELGECELFGDFGIFIQIVLGVASIGSLLGISPNLSIHHSKTSL